MAIQFKTWYFEISAHASQHATKIVHKSQFFTLPRNPYTTGCWFFFQFTFYKRAYSAVCVCVLNAISAEYSTLFRNKNNTKTKKNYEIKLKFLYVNKEDFYKEQYFIRTSFFFFVFCSIYAWFSILSVLNSFWLSNANGLPFRRGFLLFFVVVGVVSFHLLCLIQRGRASGEETINEYFEFSTWSSVQRTAFANCAVILYFAHQLLDHT